MKETGRTVATEVIGALSLELEQMRLENIPRGVSKLVPFFIKEGSGALVKDLDDNVYIDFSGGIGTLNIGHSHPEVVAAVKDQADKFFHTCSLVIMYEPYIRLTKSLNALFPGKSPAKTVFFNSGAEAVENAVKIARRFTKKSGIVSMECGYHGRTLLTMTLTSKVRPYKFGFGPFAPEIYKIPSPYCYRCRFGLKYPECDLTCARFFEKFFSLECPPENLAAVLVEPVQGEGGFIVPPPGYFTILREICDKNDILIIADEIQTGFGRTGKFFAVEHSGLQPDLLTVGKSIAAGLPLSGVIGRAEIMDAPDPGELGGTYSGNPLACCAGLKVLEVIEKEKLTQRAESVGAKMINRLKNMQQKYALIGDVRGSGAMVAIELVKDRNTKEPAAEETREIIRECYTNGLVALTAGVFNNVVRMLVPLVITDEQLAAGLDLLEDAVSKVDKNSRK